MKIAATTEIIIKCQAKIVQKIITYIYISISIYIYVQIMLSLYLCYC